MALEFKELQELGREFNEADKSITSVKRSAVNTFLTFLQEAGLDYCRLDKEAWSGFFKSLRTENIVFMGRYIPPIKKFLEFLASHGEDCSVSVKSLSEYKLSMDDIGIDTSVHFGSVGELTSALSVIVQAEADRIAVLPELCACYLTWFGLSVKEILSLERSGITVDDKREQCTIVIPGREEPLVLYYPDALNAIVDYRDATEFFTADAANGSVRRSTYASVNSFMRTRVGAITYMSLRSRILGFNKRAEELGMNKRFQLSKIAQSGTYSKTYNLLLSMGLSIKKEYDPRFKAFYVQALEVYGKDETISQQRHSVTALRAAYALFYEWCKAFKPDYFA